MHQHPTVKLNGFILKIRFEHVIHCNFITISSKDFFKEEGDFSGCNQTAI